MKINEILQPGVVQPNRGVSARTAATHVSDTVKTANIAVDSAELHLEAKVEAHLLEGAKLVFDALPDVRADRVAAATKRLAEGFYDRPEVVDQIAARLAADPEARPAAPLSLEQQSEIRRRLAEGYYDSPEAVEKIAEGLAAEA